MPAKGLPKLKAELRDLEKYKQIHQGKSFAANPALVPSIYRSKPYLLQAIKKKEEAIKKAESKKGGRKTRRSTRRGTRRN
jgi:hypothetical protein